MPGGPYLELFGRLHNRRLGWITAGNESKALLKNMPGNISSSFIQLELQPVQQQDSNSERKRIVKAHSKSGKPDQIIQNENVKAPAVKSVSQREILR